jgi:hypothetical protein
VKRKKVEGEIKAVQKEIADIQEQYDQRLKKLEQDLLEERVSYVKGMDASRLKAQQEAREVP